MKAALPALLLVALAACGRREEEWFKLRTEQHLKAAVRFEENDRLDEAIAEYRAAIALAESRDPAKWKVLLVEWHMIILQLEERKTEAATATAEFEAFKARAAKVDDADVKGLLADGRDLYARVRHLPFSWVVELAALLEGLTARVDMK